MLPYTSFSNLFVVPVAHALLYGVVKSFICFMFQKVEDLKKVVEPQLIVKSRERQLIKSRSACMSVTTDFGRKYKCVVKYHNSYRMEDFLHFVESFSYFIFLPGTLPEGLDRMWKLIQRFVNHYCRGVSFTAPGVSFEYQSKLAAQALHEYAVLVEEKFPSRMCTYNLHMVVCRLPVQEQQRGSAAKDMEMVVERSMQYFKGRIGNHNTKDPEKVFVGDLLMEKALREVVKTNPDLPSFEAMSGDNGMATFQAQGAYDQWEDTSDTLLLGKGLLPTVQQKVEITDALVAYSKVVGMQRIWTRQALDNALQAPARKAQTSMNKHVLVYTRAEVHEDVFISSAYKRVARPSSYVQVHFADLGCFIGQILFFVRVPLKDPSQEHAHESEDNHLLRLPAGDAFNSAKALRLAVIRFFQRLHLEPPASGSDIRRDTDVDEEVPRIQRFDPSRCLPCEAHDPCIITNKCIVTTVKPYYGIPYTQLTQTSRK